MNKKVALLMITGTTLGLTACGTGTPMQDTSAEQASSTESVQEESDPLQEETAEDLTEEKSDYIEDTVLSTDLFTLTIPDEFKGKFLAQIVGNEIYIYDKASNEAGFGGFVFSVIADKDKQILAGGMYTKVGELAAADGNIYDVCMSTPSEVQWDYTASEEMPEDYEKLYNSATSIIEKAVGNSGSTFMYGAGTKGENLYGYTVSKYIGAFSEGWDAAQFEENELSPEFYALYQAEGEKAFDKMGYAYADITNDGVDDLLVGVKSDSDDSFVVYDVYTMVDRTPTLVASGTSRNSYRGMIYGGLANVFSEGADEYGTKVYIIEPDSGKLFFQYGVKYDGYTDEKNPWYSSDFSGYDEEKWIPATEEDYNMWLDRATEQFLNPEFTPFSEVMPIDYSKVDLSKYATFTKMLDDFKKGMGYANEQVGDADVFFASSETYSDEDGKAYAIDSSLFVYDKNGSIVYLGQVASAGTAYPLALNDGFLYTCSHHMITKYTVQDGKLVVSEEAAEVFDTDGNATYSYAADGKAAQSVDDASNLTRLFEEYEKAAPIVFSVEK
jgi:hypothetical protein